MNIIKGNIKNEITGGVTAAFISLHIGLACGILSGLGPEYGLYSIIIVGLVTTLMGATKSIISHPTVPLAIIIGSVLVREKLTYNDPDVVMAMMIATFILAGLFQIGFGLLKLANYIRYISYSVLSGFMTGIGFLIIILQLYGITGHNGPGGILGILTNFQNGFQIENSSSIIIFVITIGLIIISKRLIKSIPAELFALVIVTLVSQFLDPTFSIIGEIPSGFPKFKGDLLLKISYTQVYDLVGDAFALACLGTISSMLTADIVSTVTKRNSKENLELIAHGIGNTIAALFGAIPGAAGTTGSMANIRVGGRERLSGFVHVGVIVIVIMGLGNYLRFIPSPAISALFIYLGWSLIDFNGILKLIRIKDRELIILLSVLVLTVFSDLITAVGVGIIMSSFFFASRMRVLLKKMSKKGTVGDIEENIKVPKFLKNEIFVIRLDGAVFYGFVKEFKEEIQQTKNIQGVLIDLSKMPYIDSSGILMLEDIVSEFKEAGVEVVLVGVNENVNEQFERLGFIPKIVGEENVYNKIKTGVRYLVEKLTHEI